MHKTPHCYACLKRGESGHAPSLSLSHSLSLSVSLSLSLTLSDFYDLTRDSPNVKRNSRAAPTKANQAAQRYARRAPNHLAGAPVPHPGEPSTNRTEVSRARLLPSRRALRITRYKQSGMTMPRSPPLPT